jgi:MaoC like domain
MSSEVTHLQICGSGCAPRSPRPSPEADIVLFAAVSRDNNAIHINEEFAAGTIFKGCIPMDCCRGDRRGHIKDIVSIRQRPAAV